MPLDERDAKFEKALRSHFRAECPDAETLAAYHERGLAAEELVSWKKHIAGCAACQEILAQLERTDDVAGQADGAPVGSDATQHVAQVLPMAARAADYGSAHPEAIPAAERMPRRIRGWKWAAPAGAIAAGLLVWLSVSELRQSHVRPQAPVQVAENRAEGGRQEPPADAGKEQTGQKVLDGGASKLARPESSAKVPSAAPPEANRVRAFNEPMAKPDRQDNEENSRTAESRANPGEKKQAAARPMQLPELKDKMASDDKAKAAEALKSIGAAAQSVEVQSDTATANAVPAPAPPLPVPAAPEAKGRDGRKNTVAGLATEQGAIGGVKSEYKREAYQLDSDATMPHAVVSADGKRTWRLGPSGQILLLDKKSAGWLTQSSGVSVGLTGGSAPTGKICWVAGREGTILLTVDGGEHWRKVASPIPGDIGGIAATDGKHAVVWDAENRAKYETSDAGVTWKARTP